MNLIKNYSDIPFGEPGDDNDVNANKGRRVRIVKEFIGRDLYKLKTLDIGQPNAFGRLLGIKDNTLKTDLNLTLIAPSKNYDLILFSEIIEHLMNPLGTLLVIHSLLKKDGVLIVSTPIANHFWMQSPHHLTEYQPKRFRKMLEYAGFRIVKYRTMLIWDWFPFMFTGIRPLLRCLLHRSQLYYLVKK